MVANTTRRSSRIDASEVNSTSSPSAYPDSVPAFSRATRARCAIRSVRRDGVDAVGADHHQLVPDPEEIPDPLIMTILFLTTASIPQARAAPSPGGQASHLERVARPLRARL